MLTTLSFNLFVDNIRKNHGLSAIFFQGATRLELPPSVSITRNPRKRVTTTITPASGAIIDRTDREALDRLTREFLDVQGDYSSGECFLWRCTVRSTYVETHKQA